jgi:hypothetical protein
MFESSTFYDDVSSVRSRVHSRFLGYRCFLAADDTQGSCASPIRSGNIVL